MDTSQHHTTHSSHAHRTTKRRRRSLNPLRRPITMRTFLNFWFLGLVAVLGAGAAIFFVWHQNYYSYTTDHAYVSGNISNVMPDRTGTITDIYYRVGDNVRKGDKIATLRTNSGGSFDAKSPIDGQIVSEGSLPNVLIGTGQQLGTGQVVNQGENIAQVVDTSTIQVTAVVDADHIKDVKPGMDVDVEVPGVTSNTLHGTVNQVLPVSAIMGVGGANSAYQQYPQWQGVPVQINLGATGSYTFRPGEQATVTIHVHQDSAEFNPTVVIGPTQTPTQEPGH